MHNRIPKRDPQTPVSLAGDDALVAAAVTIACAHLAVRAWDDAALALRAATEHQPREPR